MLKFIATIVLTMAVPACAMAKPNPLPAEIRQTLFVKDVEVIWNVDDTKDSEKPEYVAYRQDCQNRLKNTVASAFLNSPAGAEPAAFKIKVNRFDCASTGCTVRADVAVVQVSDNKELGVYQKVTGMQMASGGLLGVLVQSAVKPDVVGIATTNFAAILRARFDAKK